MNISLDKQGNNFGALRLLAALMVVCSHAFVLLRAGDDWLAQQTDGKLPFAQLGLGIFFFLSGLLVTNSYFHAASPFIFLKKRFLRIYPGLAVVVILSVFILGPCFTELPMLDYFKNTQTWRYLLNTTLISLSYKLPGVFTHNIGTDGVNGSLWTLPLEFRMYILLLLLGVLRLLKNRWVLVCLALALLVAGCFFNEIFEGWIIDWPSYVFYGMFFLLGALTFHFKNDIPLKGYLLLLLCLGWFFLKNINGVEALLRVITISYTVIYIGMLQMPKKLRVFILQQDYSYGIYIYAFPIQQILVYYCANSITPPVLFVLTALLVLPLAWCSWNWVEKKALQL